MPVRLLLSASHLWRDRMDHPNHCQCAEDQDDNRRASDDLTRLPFIAQIQRRIDSLDLPTRTRKPREDQSTQQAADVAPIINATAGDKVNHQIDYHNKDHISNGAAKLRAQQLSVLIEKNALRADQAKDRGGSANGISTRKQKR